jgi:hypothetical protein
VLHHWLTKLRLGELLAQTAGTLLQLLAQRCCAPGAAAAASDEAADADGGSVQQTCQQLVLQVTSLLRVEAEAVAAADIIESARGLLASEPEGLLQRLLLQVMEMLGVECLEGLPAAVNRVSAREVWSVSSVDINPQLQPRGLAGRCAQPHTRPSLPLLARTRTRAPQVYVHSTELSNCFRWVVVLVLVEAPTYAAPWQPACLVLTAPTAATPAGLSAACWDCRAMPGPSQRLLRFPSL